jgi:hypothetical protein
MMKKKQLNTYPGFSKPLLREELSDRKRVNFDGIE